MRETRSRALAAYDFHAGADTRAHTFWGVHRTTTGEYVFRLFAPRAEQVTLCGDFLPAGEREMMRFEDGLWELTVAAEISPEGMRYAYRLNGKTVISDPFARRGFWDGTTGSLVCTEETHLWQDAPWMESRAARNGQGNNAPINLYEVHLSSFATRQGRSCTGTDAYLNYRELGDLLARYAADMGYTHIRLWPLTEHVQENCHGNSPVGFFAPTSRHGSPDDLRAMIDRLHRVGIGVVMNLPLDRCGAAYPGVAEDGVLDPSCPETQSFLLSTVLFWIKSFHLDGVCLQYHPLWIAKGEDLLCTLCAAIRASCPDVMLIGEGELFDLTEHRRFGKDILHCIDAEPWAWPTLWDRLTLTLRETTEYGQSTLLTLPSGRHGTGRGSMTAALDGGYLQKFDAARLMLACQMAHPGKKQLFMGCELGQSRVWDGTVPPDWFLRELPIHAAFWQYVRSLNHFYRNELRLWEREDAVLTDGETASAVVLRRTDRRGRLLWCVLNFSREQSDICLSVGEEIGSLRVLFHTDETAFGGQGRIPERIDIHSRKSTLTLPPMTALFCEPLTETAVPVRQFILPTP